MKTRNAYRSSAKEARALWGDISKTAMAHLKDLVCTYAVSVRSGHLQLIDGRWYLTHAGLLRIAEQRRCVGITTSVVRALSDSGSCRWVFKAIVYKTTSGRGFSGYGDAEPSNTSLLMRGAEMRIAETRAVNRALRKAYGIGLCSVEELGSASRSGAPDGKKLKDLDPAHHHVFSNGQPKLRDQLCLLIRKHNLDPNQVKRYAADFCGTEELRGASRELIESFVTRLAEEAVKDRAALACKLNSYGDAEAVKS
jgi:hypothetical protein